MFFYSFLSRHAILVKMKVRAPGRICLFGEHQDYFGLSVIAMAINRELTIGYKPIKTNTFIIHMPDIREEDAIPLEPNLLYKNQRDYLRAGVNIFQRKGFHFDEGYECTLKSTIPLQAGCSSSSAMCVVWAKTLSEIVNHPEKDDREFLAQTAFEMEVLEFREPGGMMDHYSSSFGNLIFINFEKAPPQYKVFDHIELPGLILGDSLQKKETLDVLSKNKKAVLEASQILEKKIPEFTLQSISIEKIEPFKKNIEQDSFNRLKATLINRDITRHAFDLFSKNKFSQEEIGKLLKEQHEAIRDLLKHSTPKIDALVDAALHAGALGGKVNGSGGGGTFIVYAPGKEEDVISAILSNGGKAFLIQKSQGVACFSSPYNSLPP